MRGRTMAAFANLRLAWLAAMLALAHGCASATDAEPANGADDQAAIQALYGDWRRAVAAGDIPGYVQVLDDDVRLLPPGAAAIVGASTYGAFLRPVFESADYRIEVVQAPQVEVLGDLAVAEYEYVIHLDLKNPEQGVSEPGALTASRSQLQYFDVLRRDESGAWRVWRHTWRDSPAPEES